MGSKLKGKDPEKKYRKICDISSNYLDRTNRTDTKIYLFGSRKQGKKKILVLSIIEFVIHGALLGLAAYFAFDMIEGVLEQGGFK